MKLNMQLYIEFACLSHNIKNYQGLCLCYLYLGLVTHSTGSVYCPLAVRFRGRRPLEGAGRPYEVDELYDDVD